MNGLGQDPGGVSAVLAVAIILGGCIPMMSVALWMTTTRVPWLWATKRNWKQVLVMASILAGILLAGSTADWVHDVLLGPGRPTEQRIVVRIFGVGFAVFIATIARAARRRRLPPPLLSVAGRAKNAPKIILILLLTWVALTGALTILKVGPWSQGRVSPSDSRMLALNWALVAVLVLLLIFAIRRHRADTTRDRPKEQTER